MTLGPGAGQRGIRMCHGSVKKTGKDGGSASQGAG